MREEECHGRFGLRVKMEDVLVKVVWCAHGGFGRRRGCVVVSMKGFLVPFIFFLNEREKDG